MRPKIRTASGGTMALLCAVSTLAMAKGRALASGPILLRAGFTDYGEERCYWLPVV